MDRGFVILTVLGACAAGRAPYRSDTASIEVAYPQQELSMDRFEAMLQRASQILRSPPPVVEPSQESHNHYQPPPRDQLESVNYYLPVFQPQRNEKLDSKGRQLQYMMPPQEDNQATNFYLLKQKKVPKKFMNAGKHINLKVIEDGHAAEVPQQPRGYGNENKVVFDDVFYGVDAQSAVPEEVPQAHSTENGFIAPIYSRRLQKSEDMFATPALKRESRTNVGFPSTRFAVVRY